MSDERNKHGLSLERTARPQTEAQKQSVEKSATARYQAEHQVDAHETQSQAQLSARVADGQQRATLRYENAQQELENRQNVQRQELENRHEAEGPDVGQSREADRKAEVDTLQRFQEIQREQLTQRQQLEQSVFQEQAKALADLQGHQQQEMDELQRRANETSPSVDHTLDTQRQQLEAPQQERAQLDASFQAQLHALEVHEDAVKGQMHWDQENLNAVLSGDLQGVQRQAALDDVLARQNTERQKLEIGIKEQLTHLNRQMEASQSYSTTNQAEALGNQAGHQVDAHQAQDLTQLSAKVADGQQHAVNRQGNEQLELENRQNAQRQNLTELHEAEGPDVGQSREADRKAEVDTLQRFQEIQREQLTQHQQLEQKALQGLSEMVADLQARQHQEKTKLVPALQAQQQPNALRQHQQFESQQQQERERLVAYIAQQMQTLKDYRSELLVQTSQDEEAFQEALYRAGHDADRQDSLRDMLGKQQETRKDLERATEERLFSSFAQRAFAERFSDTRALKTLWEAATKNLEYNDNKAYDKARERFWTSVNKGISDHAKTVGRILEKAGYELQQGSNAPLLKMAGWNYSRTDAELRSGMRALRELLNDAQKNRDLTDKDVRARVASDFLRSVNEGISGNAKAAKNILEKAGEETSTLELVERRLSIDHADAQSFSASNKLRSENLRFMSQRDNSTRGNRYTEHDRLQDH